MIEQVDLLGNLINQTKPKAKTDKQKRNWENGFQRWSDKWAQESGFVYGKCGYGSMCDYCEDNGYGRPCVRALNAMCRESYINIDYSKKNYEDVWDGVFNHE